MSVRESLEKFVDAYASRDLARCLGLFRDDAIVYGTGPDERRFGIDAIAEQFKRDWAQSSQSSVVLVNTMGKEEDEHHVAFALADVIFKATLDNFEWESPGRMSVTWIRGEISGWKIVQMHCSIPTNQEEGQSYPNC